MKQPIPKEKTLLNNFKKTDKDIYESNGNNIHPGKLYMSIFNSFYSSFKVYTQMRFLKEKFIEEVKIKYKLTGKNIYVQDYVCTDEKNRKISEFHPSRAFIVIKENLAVWIETQKILILYNNTISKEEVLEIAEMTEEFKHVKIMIKEFHMVVRDETTFRLRDFEMKQYDIDLELNYNDDFKSINEIISNDLNEKRKNGIILLHGSYGSGKTYYIRYLINNINRRFIYLPLNMVNCLSDPEFIPFMSDYKDSVLILEDCENLLMHRDDGNPNAGALSNLLNLGDGLLSDAFSINIICSFNSNLKKIDDALLRKGRLIARYEFNELEIPKAQSLADKLEKNIIIEKPMTLSDIYNAESMRFENKKSSTIGFAYA